ncbi:MAG: hypothetical protein KIT62_08180 [Cyclobacteriaceae bacterium]|nr:hypothetical protein [Cyclobacteriaceae bacterium]
MESEIHYYKNLPFTGETFLDTIGGYRKDVRRVYKKVFKDGLVQSTLFTEYTDKGVSEYATQHRHIFDLDSLIDPGLMFDRVELVENTDTDRKGKEIDVVIRLNVKSPLPGDNEKLLRETYEILLKKKFLDSKKYTDVTGFIFRWNTESKLSNTIGFLKLYEKYPRKQDDNIVIFENN